MAEIATYDIVVIGAGIVGCMVARELSRYDATVAVVEREVDVGMGSSSANSAIIHSGHDPAPGTLKARLNVRGNALWKELAPQMGVPLVESGALIVAIGDEEASRLPGLAERGTENGVEGLRILSRDEVLAREPLVNPAVSGALLTPSAAVVDPFRAVLAAAEVAALNGVEFLLGRTVRAVWSTQAAGGSVSAGGDATSAGADRYPIKLDTSGGMLAARFVVNAAGVHADEIAHMAGDLPEFRIKARRGAYFVFDPAQVAVGTVLFPMPGERGKGILVTTTTHGNTMIGPNAEVIPDKEDTEVTADAQDEILTGAARLVPSLTPGGVIASFAGVRATGNHEGAGGARDFLIDHSQTIPGMVHAAGIESPGFASAPAIAEYVVDLLREAGAGFDLRSDWSGTREYRPRFAELDHDERAERIAENPQNGRIVCRCEEVTEAEVVAAINGPIPATTYDAIKRRTWLGTGRCQGSFDYPRTMEILSRELGVPMSEITKNGPGSVLLYRRTKDEVI